jgi:hypothetical protein
MDLEAGKVTSGLQLNSVKHFSVSAPLDPNEDCAIKSFEHSTPFRLGGRRKESHRRCGERRREESLLALRRDTTLSIIALYKAHCQ